MAAVEHFFGGSSSSNTNTDAPSFLPPQEVGIYDNEDSLNNNVSTTSPPSTLTDTQEKWLSILTVISSFLSIIGSSIIIHRIRRSHYKSKTTASISASNNTNNKTTTSYDRLLLGLSCCDLIASVAYGLQPFLVPKHPFGRVWAIGNDATCTFLGFLYQLAFSAMWYSGMLNYYYLFIVRFGVKRQVFAQRYEKWMHITTLGYFGITAVVGASIPGLFSEFDTGMGCWVGQYPAGCEDRGEFCIGDVIGWLFGGIPVLVVFFSLVVNNVVIFRHVRRVMSGKINLPNNSVFKHSANNNNSSSSNHNNDNNSMPTKSDNHENVDGNHISNINKIVSIEDMQEEGFSNKKQLSFSSRSGSSSGSGGGGSIGGSSAQSKSTTQRHVQEVATQGFLYVASFFVTYTPGFTVRVLGSFGFDGSKEAQIFWLLVLNAILFPLQGLFNMIVFTRPNYIRVRAAYSHNKDVSLWWMVKEACIGTDIPTLAESQNISSRRFVTANPNNKIPNSNNNSSGKGYNFNRSIPTSLPPLQEQDDESADDDGEGNDEWAEMETGAFFVEGKALASEDEEKSRTIRKPRSSSSLSSSSKSIPRWPRIEVGTKKMEEEEKSLSSSSKGIPRWPRIEVGTTKKKEEDEEEVPANEPYPNPNSTAKCTNDDDSEDDCNDDDDGRLFGLEAELSKGQQQQRRNNEGSESTTNQQGKHQTWESITIPAPTISMGRVSMDGSIHSAQN